ncbi:MAG: hypothetical protein SFW67_32135 [Myxococcaceae bacterium]|nr:hypothetical protein [Myxococcaceae bacterium]
MTHGPASLPKPAPTARAVSTSPRREASNVTGGRYADAFFAAKDVAVATRQAADRLASAPVRGCFGARDQWAAVDASATGDSSAAKPGANPKPAVGHDSKA